VDLLYELEPPVFPREAQELGIDKTGGLTVLVKVRCKSLALLCSRCLAHTKLGPGLAVKSCLRPEGVTLSVAPCTIIAERCSGISQLSQLISFATYIIRRASQGELPRGGGGRVLCGGASLATFPPPEVALVAQ